ncbi:MAG: hypothetical protein WBP57_11135 [Ignavibacteria bacterium]
MAQANEVFNHKEIETRLFNYQASEVMENYKVRVANEAESKEAQELFVGVGFRTGKYKGHDGNKQKPEYRLWLNMVKRCYSELTQKARPSYIGCSVSGNFACYDYFYDWCQSQIGFNKIGYQLDKDLLRKNNKIYSENDCVFLPSEINTALILRKSKRGDYPIGVTFCKRDNLYRSTLTMFGLNTNVGYFKDEKTAFNKYKEIKELYLKSLANMYRDGIDERAYKAHMEYEVSIDD